MESDNHLTFIFIFVLFVVACVIGVSNNRMLRERKSKNKQEQQVEGKRNNPTKEALDYLTN